MPAFEKPLEFAPVPGASPPRALSCTPSDHPAVASSFTPCAQAVFGGPGELPAIDLPPLRCNEKGCVFPARVGARGKCLYHYRQQSEPTLFRSLQPSLALMERAKFGLPDSEPDDTRVADRHRLTVERQTFLEDAA